MTKKENPITTMLISLGGSAAPVLKSIEHNQPANIIFFVSAGSYNDVTQKVLPEIIKPGRNIPLFEIVQTPDEQDLGQSTLALLREVPSSMKKMHAEGEWPGLVDFTGGTKVMSAAVVWASSRYPCQFSYVGTDTPSARSKGGLGVVIDGREKCIITANPWNEIAWFELKDAIALFNAGQYANAANRISQMPAKITKPDYKRLIEQLGAVWQAYAEWDVFNHKAAISKMQSGLAILQDLAPNGEKLIPGLTDFTNHSLDCYEQLRGIMRNTKKSLSWELIHDLVANAHRRMHLEHKYEDATARLYAAVEKIGKHALKLRHGIDNSNARAEQLPDHLQAAYTAKYLDSGTGKLKFGLQATYDLLVELQDPVAKQYQACAGMLHKLLPLRNDSILGHGTTPVSQQNCENLFEVTCQLLDITQEKLTIFPIFRSANAKI